MADSYSSLIGKTFHSLTFLRPTTADAGKMRGIFRCVCGSVVEIRISSAKSGNNQSCGCLRYAVSPTRITIQSGEKYGMLTVVDEAPRRPGNANWRMTARCDCGVVKEYFLYELRTGGTKSCGCVSRDSHINETHGHTSNGHFSPEYYTWTSMKTRCTNPKSEAWHDYGGRGISICDRWLNSFEAFLADMGVRPVGSTLERRDVDGDYSAENCVWATRKQQANNKRSNIFLEYGGARKTIAEWAEEYGLAYNTLFARVERLKWPIEKALMTRPRASYQR